MKRYSFALMIIVSAFYFSACGNQQTKEKDDQTDKLSGAESVRPESETPKDAPAGPEIKNQKCASKQIMEI